ncbi:MAG TPA: hypothetical protein VG944_18370 [Fimbriimonas sp.]|nr:hypothetical protein [Fimbriimonas sp.]
MIRPAERRDVPQIWNLILGLAEYERLSHAVSGTQQDWSGGSSMSLW